VVVLVQVAKAATVTLVQVQPQVAALAGHGIQQPQDDPADQAVVAELPVADLVIDIEYQAALP
jgi:hypothetical protein